METNIPLNHTTEPTPRDYHYMGNNIIKISNSPFKNDPFHAFLWLPLERTSVFHKHFTALQKYALPLGDKAESNKESYQDLTIKIETMSNFYHKESHQNFIS